MDTNTTLAELRQLVANFITERNWTYFHSPKNLAMSITIEAAELLEHFQWVTPEQSQEMVKSEPKLAEVADELADVLIYCLAFANHCQIDISQAVRSKMKRNEGRFPINP